MANFLGIEYQPHDALEDAIACGKVFFRAVEISELNPLEWNNKLSQPISYPSQ